MGKNYSIEDGRKLIKFARANIKHFLESGKKLSISPELKQLYSNKGGAFVTLNKLTETQDTSLRGCIGIILPHYPLIDTIHQMSIASAVEDPRFPEVKLQELDKILIEISLLSIPEKLIVQNPDEYIEKIVIGRDGLIVTRGSKRGLLLPQVPIEHDRKWDVKTFLEHTCQKAWLSPDAWQDIKHTQIESFQATIFEELTPNGDVREKEIGE